MYIEIESVLLNTNKKVGKNDSMVILKTNIAWNIGEFTAIPDFAWFTLDVIFLKKNIYIKVWEIQY